MYNRALPSKVESLSGTCCTCYMCDTLPAWSFLCVNNSEVTRTTYFQSHARDWYAGRVSALNLIALPFIGFVIPQKCFEIAKECLPERLAMWFTKLFHLLSCSEMISFWFTLSE